MEYLIVQQSSIVTLESEVRSFLKDNWIPLGGMTTTSENIKRLHPASSEVMVDVVEHTYYQTITKPNKPNPVSKKSSLQPIAVVNLWNEFAEVFKLKAKIKVIPSLEKTISARINEKDGFPTIEDWTSYFEAISRSSFLRGKNDRNWKASLEWAVRPKSIAGVIEGNYHS